MASDLSSVPNVEVVYIPASKIREGLGKNPPGDHSTGRIARDIFDVVEMIKHFGSKLVQEPAHEGTLANQPFDHDIARPKIAGGVVERLLASVDVSDLECIDGKHSYHEITDDRFHFFTYAWFSSAGIIPK